MLFKEFGVRLPPWFACTPSYWLGESESESQSHARNGQDKVGQPRPFDTGCAPLGYCGNPGVNCRSDRGAYRRSYHRVGPRARALG